MRRLAMRMLVMIAAAAGLLGLTGEAGAYWPGWWGYGVPFNTYSPEYIPYYALHPPVYYSFPVARTYGYSPFAYPPYVLTPPLDVAVGYAEPAFEVVPQIIINPYVEQNRAAEEEAPGSPSPSDVPAQSSANQQSRARPQVIYPIRQFQGESSVAQRP